MDLRIGTSGWSYPSGRGTWNGVFYPRPDDRPRGFDELAFYAERFNTVEINSTFYGQPRAAVALGWVRRTPPGFDFTVKLFQKFTHPGMAAAGAITREDLDVFRRGIEPLAAAGKLGALLAQFPPGFHDTPEAREYLAWLLASFGDYPVAVELRHRSWSDASVETSAWLDVHGAAWVQIDEPKFDSSVQQDFTPWGNRLFYARLHGRNAAEWWTHDAAEDRYNYLYTDAELKPLAARARAAAGQVKKAYLFLNNHFSAASIANATMIRALVDDPVTALVPSELVDRHPAIDRLVSTLPRARLI